LLDKIQMNRSENLAKTLYDLGKLTFAGLVIGYFVNPSVKFWVLILGVNFTFFIFYIAFVIDKK